MPKFLARTRSRAADGPAISWAQIAAAATVIAVALAAALVVVASIHGADTLSTVALALAVLAFTTQILVFVADAWTTNRLNAETHGLLQEVRTRAQGTEKALGKQVDTLTKHLIEGVEKQYKGGQDSPADLRLWIGEEVRAALSSSPAAPGSAYETSDLETDIETNEANRVRAEELEILPDEDIGRKLLTEIGELRPLTVASLSDFAQDEWRSRSLGIDPYVALRDHHPFTDELIETGFVEAYGSDTDGRDRARLTAKGRNAARLILGPKEEESIPEWLWQQNATTDRS